MKIPFLNLKAQHETIKDDIDKAISSALGQFQFIRGKDVVLFEEAFSKIHGRPCVATGNGTDALFLSLKALGISSGDEVITPAWSWISTAETITHCGAKPVFADADLLSYTVNADHIKQKITGKTKAVIAVHLYGQAAHVKELRTFCDEHKLFLIEDCAQGHLTREDGQPAGSFGDCAAFSFYPSKNLGAYGDAGCVLTKDRALEEKVRRLANHGALVKDDHTTEGFNSRMDTLQAAVLNAKLPHLKGWTEKRINNAALYQKNLKDIKGVILPRVRQNTVHTFHIFAIRAQRRDELKLFLKENGIQTLIHYPRALTNLEIYAKTAGHISEFPVANALEKDMLSLPIYPELKTAEIEYICEKITAFYQHKP